MVSLDWNWMREMGLKKKKIEIVAESRTKKSKRGGEKYSVGMRLGYFTVRRQKIGLHFRERDSGLA